MDHLLNISPPFITPRYPIPPCNCARVNSRNFLNSSWHCCLKSSQQSGIHDAYSASSSFSILTIYGVFTYQWITSSILQVVNRRARNFTVMGLVERTIVFCMRVVRPTSLPSMMTTGLEGSTVGATSSLALSLFAGGGL